MDIRNQDANKSNDNFNILNEVTRKAVHLSVLLIPIGYHVLKFPLSLIQMCLLGVLCFFVPMEIYRLKINPNMWINFITRPSEKKEPANYVITTAIWLLIILGVEVFYSIIIAELALVATVLGDSIAAIIGKGIGTHRLPFTSKKTIEGYISGLIGTYIIGVVFLLTINEFSLLFPLLPTIAWGVFDFFEDLPWYFADNIFHPLITLLLASLLSLFGLRI